ncbi:Fic family protein [Candidatus Poriferisocius sp.]|uniref:Fic family protein n=1 Tax=Candidatus Poriferisocius sp. TaxID=3101276 RepID=UPI003B020CBF
MRALATRHHTGLDPARGAVAEVIGNIAATSQAQQMLSQRQEIDVRTLLVAHRVLMDASPSPHLGGVVRLEQNWVGGNDWHPLDGDFVPPPPDMCQPLLADLVNYLRSEDHSPLLQAAVAHAQFETIHPFGDGNGRAGRAVLYGVLKQRCAANGMMPPISLALSGNRGAYLDSLAEFQTYVGAAHDPGRSAALVRWLEVLATAVHQSSVAVVGYQKAIEVLQRHWRAAVGGRRGRSAISAIIDHLPTNPSVTAKTLSEATGFSERRCADALRRLKAVGVVKDRTVGPSLRVYEADKIFDVFAVMSSTVCDPKSSDREYAPVLACPMLPVPGLTARP